MECTIFLSTLLTKFDSCERARDQVQVECQKGRDNECKHTGEDVCSHDEVADFVVEAIGMAHRACYDRVAREHNELAGQRAVEKHVQEELVVIEANAVGHPWAVVVHL